jgi:hypothetical protein
MGRVPMVRLPALRLWAQAPALPVLACRLAASVALPEVSLILRMVPMPAQPFASAAAASPALVAARC